MRFANPEAFYLLIFLIPICWYYYYREKKKRPAIRYSNVNTIKAVHKSTTAQLRHILIVLRVIGFSLLVCALARPQRGHTHSNITSHGVDINLLLDVSGSMRALDFKPKNRLTAAKETIKKFIEKRTSDRIGLVVFGSRGYTKCPLTLDYTILGKFVDDVDFSEIENGTAIGTAIATGASRLQDSKAKSRIMILLTDGENTAGEISPEIAAQAAKELGIKIYTIGIGKGGMVDFPTSQVDPWTGRVHQRVVKREIKVDEQLLTNIANMTGGKYFRAHDTKKLEEIYAVIDKLEKSKIETKTYTTYSEHFFLWLLSGFIVLLLELILQQTRFRRIP